MEVDIVHLHGLGFPGKVLGGQEIGDYIGVFHPEAVESLVFLFRVYPLAGPGHQYPDTGPRLLGAQGKGIEVAAGVGGREGTHVADNAAFGVQPCQKACQIAGLIVAHGVAQYVLGGHFPHGVGMEAYLGVFVCHGFQAVLVAGSGNKNIPYSLFGQPFRDFLQIVVSDADVFLDVKVIACYIAGFLQSPGYFPGPAGGIFGACQDQGHGGLPLPGGTAEIFDGKDYAEAQRQSQQ